MSYRSSSQVAIDFVVEMLRVSWKRPLSEIEDTNSAPANKRQEIEPKSPKTASRDVSDELMEAFRGMEDIDSSPTKSNPKSSPARVSKGAEKQDVSAHVAAGFEFEKDRPTGLPYIYIVLEEIHDRRKDDYDFEVVSTFASLEDANNCVRTHSANYAKRDDPDALFSEAVSLDGRIRWIYQDEDPLKTEVRIKKCLIKAPGPVPAQD